MWINSSCPGQSGRHFADDIFKYIFVKEKLSILIRISLKFVTTGPIDNKPALVQIMVWCIIWIDADSVHWRMYSALGEMSSYGL